MPLIEAMARGIAAGTPPGDPLALAPTEPSPPVVARPPVAEEPETAAPPKPATTAEGRASGEQARRLRMTPLIAAGALVLVAASAWSILRRPSGGDSAAVATPVAPAAPIAPAAPAAPVPEPCRCAGRAARTGARGSPRAPSTAPSHRPPVTDQ